VAFLCDEQESEPWFPFSSDASGAGSNASFCLVSSAKLIYTASHDFLA
jgi:hypothetical protein